MKFAYNFLQPSGAALASAVVAGPLPTFSRGSAGFAVRNDGVLLNHAIDVPRFDHDRLDPFARRGLLVEKTKNNLANRSEEFDQSIWVKTQLTVTQNATAAPDNAVTADRLVEAAVTAEHRATQTNSSLTDNTQYTFSCYLKRATRQWAYLGFLTKSNVAIIQWFDLLNGVLGSASGAVLNPRITRQLNDWYRCSLTANVLSGGTTPSVRVGLANNNGTLSYAGSTAESGFAWGAQLELAPISSYRGPTGATLLPRTRDIVNVTLAPFSVAQGRMAAVVRAGESDQGVLLQLDDGGENNRIRLVRLASNDVHFIMTTGSAQQFSLNLGAVAVDAIASVSAAWRPSHFVGQIAGNAAVSTATGTIPGGLTTLRIGAASAAGEGWGGTIQHATLETATQRLLQARPTHFNQSVFRTGVQR